MNIDTISVIIEVIQIAALIYVIAGIVRIIPGNTEKTMTLVYFLAAVVSFLASGLYWFAYGILRPEIRMPFAANEIGEAALFLLLASSLETIFPGKSSGSKTLIPATVFTVLFAASSAALWIGWSGEWIEDILIGIAFGYLQCKVVRALALSGAFSDTEWKISAILCTLLIIMQAATFHLSEYAARKLDLLCCLLMSGMIALILAKNVRAFRSSDDPGVLVSCAFAGFTAATTVMYMSSGWWYSMFLCAAIVFLLLMFCAVKKETKSGVTKDAGKSGA